MKKFIILCLFLFFLGSVSAIGVTPSSYEVNFKPGLTQDFVFTFNLPGQSEVYVLGDFADYISVDKKIINENEKVTASLNLPESSNNYGVNRIRIGAKQISESEGGVGLVADARGIIKVNVPYPGIHFATEFSVSNSNIGEVNNVHFKIYNNGEQKQDVSPIVIVYFNSKEIEKIEFEEKSLESSSFVEYNRTINLSESGDYSAKLIFKDVMAETSFNVGKLYIEILETTKKIEEDKINKFNVSIRSFSNYLIKGVYAVIDVQDSNLSFSTPIQEVQTGNSVLTGFIDSNELGKGEYKANITVYYSNLSNSKIVLFRVGEVNYLLYLVVILVLLVVIFVFFRIRKRNLLKAKVKIRKK